MSSLAVLGYEVDFEVTLAVFSGFAFDHAELVVGSVAVGFANGGDQVVEVGFHELEGRVGLFAVLSATVLPALALVAEVPCRQNVFPFYPAGPVFILSGGIATRGEVHFGLLSDLFVFAATVEGGVLVFVDGVEGDPFGL